MAVQASASVSVTDTLTGKSLKISANNIINFLTVGVNTQITYIDNRGRIRSRLVTQTTAAISAAALRTQPVTQSTGVIYINSDKIIFLDDLTTSRLITYDGGKNIIDKYFVSETAAAINLAAGNTFAITVQPSQITLGQPVVRFINNLRVDTITDEPIASAPQIAFTTRVKSATGIITNIGSNYTNPTVSITGGGGAGAIGSLRTQVLAATVVNGGGAGAPGPVTITGVTGGGTPFQATGVIDGAGILTGPLVITVAGDYVTPVNNIANEPVTGGGLVGAAVSVNLGLLAFDINATGTGFAGYPAFTVSDLTGTLGAVTAQMEVESPLILVSGGSEINTPVTLTFSVGTVTAIASATVDPITQTVTAANLTIAGGYLLGTDAYPSLSITGGAGAFIKYDAKGTAFIDLEVQESATQVQGNINAL